MLRALLLYLSHAEWAQRLVTRWSLAWRVSSRFVAGETLADAVRVVRQLNGKGMYVTLDHLGEHTTSEAEARRATEAIVSAIDAIDRQRLKAGVSIKLTQLGLELDDMLCAQNLAYLLGYAQEVGVFVRIDMEDSPYVERTLHLYEWMKGHVGCEVVGVVIQAYLYRSVDDVQRLMGDATRIRLVKGAYKEPPQVAYPRKRDTDANFDRLTDLLIESTLNNGVPLARGDGRLPPILAVASHDEKRIQHAKRAADGAGLPREAVEFQMLYGVRRDLQERLVAEGYPVRVYVPYGRQWYPYFMRRLAERPANLWFFIANLFRR